MADFIQSSSDRKLAMFLYVLKKELLDQLGVNQGMLVVHPFDAHGKKHGHKDAGLSSALKLKGAVDGTKIMDLKGVANLQAEISFNVFRRIIDSFKKSRGRQLVSHLRSHVGKNLCFQRPLLCPFH